MSSMPETEEEGKTSQEWYENKGFGPQDWDNEGKSEGEVAVEPRILQEAEAFRKEAVASRDSAQKEWTRISSRFVSKYGITAPRFGVDNLARSDAERVLSYAADELARVGDKVYLHDGLGFWRLYAASDFVCQARVDFLTGFSREQAAAELAVLPAVREMPTSYHPQAERNEVLQELVSHAIREELIASPSQTEQVARALRIAALRDARVKELSETEFNDWNGRRNILPVQHGAGLLVAGTGQTVPEGPAGKGGARDVNQKGHWIPPERMKYEYLLDIGWSLPRYEPIVVGSAGEQAFQRAVEWYGEELFDQFAYLMLCRPDSIATLVSHVTGFGKSLFQTLAAKAFPEIVKTMTADQAFSRSGDKWGSVKYRQTNSRVVMIDEIGQQLPNNQKELRAGQVNTWTMDELTIERKFMDEEVLPRLGCVFLFGHDWPPVDTTQQGVERRLAWAREYETGAQMQGELYYALQQPQAIAAFREDVIQRMVRMSSMTQEEAGALSQTERCQAARASFFAARSDPIVAIMLESLEYLDGQNDWAYVPNQMLLDLVTELIASESEADIKHADIKAAGNKAFPQVFLRSGGSKRMRYPKGGKQHRCWGPNLRVREEYLTSGLSGSQKYAQWLADRRAAT